MVGERSLGGVMAARYALKHPKRLKEVWFLASCPEKKGSLRTAGLPAGFGSYGPQRVTMLQANGR
ncbi:alpha/beta hydrolase [Paenibacillus agricola]|uniref:Alpha/beta hydrolase fold-5 domain-containing protein n=1 Tax=Paenibacillus agricola TaxID=2716264 RepID=A0ABX0JAW5_9BACL|nr:alpha/beta hydrolase [Paenibacillus agricola]NHN31918.1 hypothetical protein [Paenibacillus agricola]